MFTRSQNLFICICLKSTRFYRRYQLLSVLGKKAFALRLLLDARKPLDVSLTQRNHSKSVRKVHTKKHLFHDVFNIGGSYFMFYKATYINFEQPSGSSALQVLLTQMWDLIVKVSTCLLI